MLIWFVVISLLISIGIGLYAATRAHNTKDYAVAADFIGSLFVSNIPRV